MVPTSESTVAVVLTGAGGGAVGVGVAAGALECDSSALLLVRSSRVRLFCDVLDVSVE